MQNPFEELYRQANQGTAEEKHARRRSHPILVDVEPTNACNFRCIMCPTGNMAMSRKTGMMSVDTFRSVLRLVPEGTGIRFIQWGEPLLNPDLLQMICEAKQARMLTHINTNGSILVEKPELCRALVGAGLDSIKLSANGTTRSEYTMLRGTDMLLQLRGVVDQLVEARRKAMSGGPWIAISTTRTWRNEQDEKSFLRLFDTADEAMIGETIWSYWDHKAMRVNERQRADINMLMSRSAQPHELSHPDPCPQVWDWLSVHWDGSVPVCCNSFDNETNCGNVNDAKSLGEIWFHPELEAYRARLAGHEYTGPLCSVCFDYAETKR